MREKIKKYKWYLILHCILFMYSLGGIFSKKAAQEEIFSFKFLLFYGIVISILFIYAIVWQQILKKMPLTVAFSNKAVTIVWGIIWGVLFFHEQIKWNMILGAGIIIFGITMVVNADE